MTRKKVIIGVLSVVLVGALLLVGFWDALIVRIAPGSVLGHALQVSLTQLHNRFDKDPIISFFSVLHPKGKQTVYLELTSNSSYLGNIQYDMEIQAEPHRLSGNGRIGNDRLSLELEAYADPVFMAISSPDLLSGQYYGITYNTFESDVRSIPLLTWLTGEQILQSWNARVMEIKELMERGYSVPNLPAVDLGELEELLISVLSSPCKVNKVRTTVRGMEQECTEISYSLTDREVLNLFRPIIAAYETDLSEATICFYLMEQTLTAVEVRVEGNSFDRIVRLALGADILADPIEAEVSTRKGDASTSEKITFHATEENGRLCRRIAFYSGDLQMKTISYEFESASGDIQITIDGKTQISLKMEETEEGIRLESDDFSELWKYATGKKDTQQLPVSGTVTITKGCSIDVPGYKNLDQWSLEDFLMLLEEVGGFIGFRFPI